jgi:hypothetical protein
MIANEVQGKPPKPSIRGFKSKFGIKDSIDFGNPKSARTPIAKPFPNENTQEGV